MIIGLVAVLLLCPCLGLTGFAVWRATSADDASPTVVTSAEPSAAATEEPGTDPSTAEPDPTEGIDVAVGDCVVNDGTDEDAELREVPCGPDTFEVLLRIPETTDGQRCRTLSPRSTANYVHDNPVDLFDYVLCLGKHS
ncbi:LppU/SCO3897 family protein [Micromonospora purpureochromogenes]|uniref:LppU/SCO3897 family protein n=1 Tax=Micromonospora purpureochromogenes TaxID=47872 RepID=UPI000B5AD1D0